jgi:hypothetical protein
LTTIIILSVIIAALIMGLIIASNWRGAAEKYADAIDALIPFRRTWASKPSSREAEFLSLVREQRILFGIIAAFAAACLIAILAGVVLNLR